MFFAKGVLGSNSWVFKSISLSLGKAVSRGPKIYIDLRISSPQLETNYLSNIFQAHLQYIARPVNVRH